MNARDPLELLNAYLDDELEDSERREVESLLTAEPSLQQALDELRAVKSLVKQKASLPSLPADFRERVFSSGSALSSNAPSSNAPSSNAPSSNATGTVTSRGPSFRKALLPVAAAAAIVVIGLLITFLPGQPPGIAHAAVVSNVAADFMNTRELPTALEGPEQEILANIEKQFGIRLAALPRIRDARFLSFCDARFRTGPTGKFVQGVRLDYQDSLYANQSCPRSVLSIFVLPARQVRSPSDDHQLVEVFEFRDQRVGCYSCPLSAGVNVFCFKIDSQAFNVATLNAMAMR